MQDVLVTLPKLSSYQYKDKVTKDAIKERFNEWVLWVKERGNGIMFFREDMLAVELYHDSKELDIKWLSVLNKYDVDFLRNFAMGYPETYNSLESFSCDESYIRKAAEKYKSKTLRQCDRDQQVFLLNRLDSINQRIAYAASLVVKDARAVLQFRNNNNFTQSVKTFLGDGRFYMEVDVVSGVYKAYYGGVALEAEDLDKVARYMR